MLPYLGLYSCRGWTERPTLEVSKNSIYTLCLRFAKELRDLRLCEITTLLKQPCTESRHHGQRFIDNVYTYICVCVCVYVCMYVYTYIYMYSYTWTYVYIYIYIYMYTHVTQEI